VWSVGRDLLALYADPLDTQLERFRELLGTGLPDEVILLDVRVDQALARLGARGRELELHETAPYLTAVRNRFEQGARLAGGDAGRTGPSDRQR
jgi:deoxyadenosine/deoxycytidine kinase